MKAERLGIDPNSPNADRTYKHWYRTLSNFVKSLAASRGNSQSTERLTPSTIDKFNLLINYIECSIFEYTSECETFDEAIQTLQLVYVKPKNIILARRILATRKQKSGETLDQYLSELKALTKNCDFKAVTSEQYKSEMVRDAFINGLSLIIFVKSYWKIKL